MSPTKYRDFPQYQPKNDSPLAFTRFCKGGTGIPGVWSSTTNLFESTDGHVKCPPEDVVEWRPLPGYVPVPPVLFFYIGWQTDLDVLMWSVQGNGLITCDVEQAQSGQEEFVPFMPGARLIDATSSQDDSCSYRLVIHRPGQPDVTTPGVTYP